jgi:serine phosphatase RsbU (regulator of sigma subunit)
MLWLGIFDAMGHGVEAARLAALAISAHRNVRRRGDGLHRQALGIHEVLSGRAQGFVTGQLGAIDLADPSRSAIVNAGHPAPWIQRGSEEPRRVRLGVDLPFGVPFPNTLEPQPLELLPGDRLVMFSDGVTEARPDGGQPFGEDQLARGLHALRSVSPREAARRLIAMVLAHRAADLADDATVLVLDVAGSS